MSRKSNDTPDNHFAKPCIYFTCTHGSHTMHQHNYLFVFPMPIMVHDLYCCTHVKYRRSLNGNCVCIYYSYYAISKHMTTRHMLRCKLRALIPSCIQFIKQDTYVPVYNYIEVYGCFITWSEPVCLKWQC